VPRRRLILVVILVAAFAGAGGPARLAQSTAGASSPCGLRLPAAQRGELPFRVPRGGRALRRVLAARFALCTLYRRDGSRFALLHSDADNRVLGVAFYRPSGALLNAVDSSYLVADQNPAEVKCDSSSSASIGSVYWKKARKWWIGATAPGLNRDAVVTAVRNAQSEWTNDVNYCGIKDQANPPSSYQGTTSVAADKNDGKSVIDWGSLANDQDCSQALACTFTWYDGSGTPIESDIRFNTAFKWSTTGASGMVDIQTIAAHEIGHVLQFDHVTNSSKNDDTTLMWPYFSSGDTSGRKLGRGDALADNNHY
jgi:Matrixin